MNKSHLPFFVVLMVSIGISSYISYTLSQGGLRPETPSTPLAFQSTQRVPKVSVQLCGEYAQFQICREKKWGKGLGQCILDNSSTLKPYCDLVVSSYQQAFHICSSDVQKFCLNKKAGTLASCLFQNTKDISDPCKKAIDSVFYSETSP